jgi:hypothetical protein
MSFLKPDQHTLESDDRVLHVAGSAHQSDTTPSLVITFPTLSAISKKWQPDGPITFGSVQNQLLERVPDSQPVVEAGIPHTS